METTTDGNPSFGERAGLAVGFLAISGSILAAHLIVRAKSKVMHELNLVVPTTTRVARGFFDDSPFWFVATAVAGVVLAGFSLRGKLGRTGWIIPVLLFAAALGLQAFIYVAMEMPLVKLREHLGR